MHIKGQCHCGNIAFALDWAPEPTVIPARACQCSFCVKHGGVWTSCPGGALRVNVCEPALVNRYSFGTQTAVFHICMRCGVVPVVTSEIAGHTYAVVSVHALEGIDPAMLHHASASFDAEDLASRLARRAKNWIADVQFEG